MRGRMRTFALKFAAFAALFGVLGALYGYGIRPRQLRWGATAAEIEHAIPEDDIVRHPAFDATRAITIHARPDEIWPWLVQMGYSRAGFYGYDMIENPGSGTGIRSARTIRPAFQHPHTGDVLPLSVAASLEFGSIEPNRRLVWRAHDVPPSGVFIWQLVPVDGNSTRLISRIRWRYLSDWLGFSLGIFTEFADHVAVRAILCGIRDRAEHRKPQLLAVQGIEIGAWFLAFGAFCVCIAVFVLRRRWGIAWLLALGAGLLLLLELYASPPGLLSGALSIAFLWLMIRSLRRAGSSPSAPAIQ